MLLLNLNLHIYLEWRQMLLLKTFSETVSFHSVENPFDTENYCYKNKAANSFTCKILKRIENTMKHDILQNFHSQITSLFLQIIVFQQKRES